MKHVKITLIYLIAIVAGGMVGTGIHFYKEHNEHTNTKQVTYSHYA